MSPVTQSSAFEIGNISNTYTYIEATPEKNPQRSNLPQVNKLQGKEGLGNSYYIYNLVFKLSSL